MSKRKVPASASLFNAEVEFAQNKETDKTAKVKLLARTGAPINHPYWGAIVHDLSGMRLHKNRLSIDYNHNGDEIIGYLNKFEIDTGDLVTSGALTPFEEKDRASEIIFKMREGVPYEASINFSDDMVIQEYSDSEIVNVNGRDIQGPLTVVREWGLRNVAICPMGADKNTEASLFNNSNKDFHVTVLEKEIEMKVEQAVEVKATELAVETEAVVEVATEVVAEEVVEESADKAAELSEATTEVVTEEATKETELSVSVVTEEVVEVADNSAKEISLRDEFKSMVTEFGLENASKYFADGTSLIAAREMHYETLKSENQKLKEQLSQVTKDVSVTFQASDGVDLAMEARVKSFMQRGLSEASARHAASVRV